MKPQTDLLGRLQQLNPRDRGWIMQQLSERERAQLLSTLEVSEKTPEIASAKVQEVRAAVPSETKKIGSERTLSRVEPRTMAALLKHEPAWIAAIVLLEQDESWSREVLDALPSLQRSEVERARAQSFGDQLVQSVLRQVLERCQGDVATASAFDRLVERIGASRTKRRLTLHL